MNNIIAWFLEPPTYTHCKWCGIDTHNTDFCSPECFDEFVQNEEHENNAPDSYN